VSGGRKFVLIDYIFTIIINPLKMKRRMLYTPSSYRAVNTFRLGFKKVICLRYVEHNSVFVPR
jgi:hypothetical protein